MENDAAQPSTSKKRHRKKQSKKDHRHEESSTSSSDGDDDEVEETMTAKRRKFGGKSKKSSFSGDIQDIQEEKLPKMSKAKKNLEQMLIEAERIEARAKETIEVVETEDEKNDCELLMRIPWKMDVHMQNDLVSIVIDEISLEGLDGITLEALWLRLSIVMGAEVPQSFRDTIWNIIISNKLDFYELPEARGKLVMFDRFKHIDVNSGHLIDVDDVPEDIYPFAPLSDEESNQTNIYGSCATFKTRIRVTEKLRNLNLDEAEGLGNKLIIVAHQSLRTECLGLNEAKSLTKVYNQHYCLLERIGRARKPGEVSIGKTSLRQFGDSKDMFYLRKVLLKNDLITKQQLCFKNKGMNGNTSALLFHLKRFHFHYKSKRALVIERTVDLLKKKPNFRMEYAELKQIFGLDAWQNAVVKMLKGNEFRQFVNTNILVPYRDIYPNAPKDEWMTKHKKEKHIRVIQLIDPNVNVANSLKEFAKEELQKDDSSDDEPLCEGSFNKSTFNQIYNVIYESGTDGLTQSQITLKLGLDIYQSRLVIKSLERESLIYSVNADLGCFRVLKFFATSYQKQHPEELPAAEEEPDEEAVDFLSSVLEIDKKYLTTPNDDTNPKENSTNSNPEKNSLKGQYEFIKEHRKQCRQDKYNARFRGKFYDVQNLEAGKRRMEEILRNDHEFFSMDDLVSNGLVKTLDLNVPLPLHLEFEDEDVVGNKGFDFFEECHKVPKTKPTIDHNHLHSQVTNFLRANNNKAVREIFVDKPQNLSSTKLMVDYLKIDSDVPINALLEKFDASIDSIREEKPNNGPEYPRELDDSGEEENSESLDKLSLIENVENEQVDGKEISEEIASFKSDLIKRFEERNFRIEEKFLESQKDATVKESDQEIELIKPDEERTLKKMFEEDTADSWKEFERSHFNSLIQDFQIEPYFGESILVNYLSLDKDEIETIIIFSKSKEVAIDIGTKYINRTLSQRALDRANYILDILYKDKIVSDLSGVLSGLKKDELDKGLVGTIDKKSMNRLLEKMANEGFLITIKVVLRHKKSIRTKHIIALPNSDYQPILNAVKEQMKMSFFIYSRRKNVATTKDGKAESTEGVQSISATKIQEIEVDVYGTPKFRRNKYVGKYYGYLPKNSRHRVLHEFLFYLIYSYDGQLVEKSKLPNYMKQNNLEEYHLYQKDISWKMFIPPLSEYKNYPSGWILYCDALLRMPISTFIKIYNVVYVIPELVHILNDPIKKYLLLQNIPPKIRNACFFKRKYIFSIYEGLQHLCYLGLLQFGEQTICTKDQQFLYLNRKAMIYDTTSSKPGYHQTTEKEYPELRFDFQTEEDVENYWNRVWNICFKTRLGIRYSLLHQTITLQKIHAIPEMIQACQPRSHEMASENDVGYIPGDGRGACGFDSNSWMYVKRNWIESSVMKDTGKFDVSSSRPIGIRKKQLDKAKTKTIKLKDLQKELLKKKRKRKVGCEIFGNLQETEQVAQTASKIKKVARNKPFTRKIRPRPPHKKIVRVDELDTTIKKSGLFIRSRFTHVEDNMLMIISYAIRYLFPAFKKRLLAFNVIRDLMHRLCPKSYKKTSTAYNCRLRRFCRIINKPPDMDTNNVNLEADHFVQKHFSKFKEKILAPRKIPQDHLHIALIYLVAYCVDSFEKNATTSKKILDEVGYVDYLEGEVFDKKNQPDQIKNSLYQDPCSKEEILIDTIKAVIHSSIGFEANNTIKILYEHLDNIYQTYSEEILRKSVLSLREHNLIKTPIIHKKSKKSKSESILQTSYMYCYKQITKFREHIYMEAYSVFDALKATSSIKKFNSQSYQEGFGLGFSEVQTLATINIHVKIPNKQFILDPNTDNHDSVIRELNARYKRLNSKKAQDQEMMSEPKDNQEKNEVTDRDDDNTLKDLEELSNCIKDRDYDKINTKMSDLAFLLTKGLFPELEDEDDRLERLSRHFLTMYPEVGFQIDHLTEEIFVDEIDRGGGMERIEETICRDCILRNFEMSPADLEKSLIEIGAHLNDVELAVRLLTFIQDKEILGASGSEIKEKFTNNYGTLSLETIVGHLLNVGAIFWFGVKTFRFVHHQFTDVWTVECKQEEQTVSGLRLKPVPWLKINGTVSSRVLVDWLFAIQSYCISYPVSTFMSLCKRFNFLKPVDIYVLLKYLQLLNCLELKCYENVEEVSIFTEPNETGSRKSNVLDSLENVYVETDNLAVIKLGSFVRGDQDLMSPFEE